MTNLEVIETWMRRVWKEQDADAIREMFLPDGTAEGLGEKMIGPEDFKMFHRQLLGLIDNVDVQVQKHFQDGSWSSALCKLDCVRKNDSSQKLQMTGTVVLKIENNTIVEAYNHFDFMGLFEQLGLLPDGTFARCLEGSGVTVD